MEKTKYNNHMKKQVLRVVAFCLVFMLVLSLASSAMAANACYSVNGNAGSTKVFCATTDNNWRIGYDKLVLTQNKGTMQYETASSYYKSTAMYGWYTVRVFDQTANKVITNKTWKDGQFTIYLPNQKHTYKITVTPYTVSAMNVSNRGILNFLCGKYYTKWLSAATWSVTKTRGVTLCR